MSVADPLPTIRQPDTATKIPPRLVRQIWATLVVFGIVLFVLGAVIGAVLMAVTKINNSLNQGTPSGNTTRSIVCQLYVELDQPLPSLCQDPDLVVLMPSVTTVPVPSTTP